MIIGNAQVFTSAEAFRSGSGSLRDVAIANGKVNFTSASAVDIEANGRALLPALNDHHLHFRGYAAALHSVHCGPPAITSEDELAEILSKPGTGWLRGIGYHESVAGEIDCTWLDRIVPDRPVRIQHRSGRLWVLNSRALAILDNKVAHGSKVAHDSGRIYDADQYLSNLWGHAPLPVEQASRQLASFGIVGFTDMTPSNDGQTLQQFSEWRSNGLLQTMRFAGRVDSPTDLTKLHLHDSQLPTLAQVVRTIQRSHESDKPVAVHCVTELGLVFTLAAFREAGTRPGDRIEHASVAPTELQQQLHELQLQVVTQPNFVFDRGDVYLKEIASRDHANLYRLKSWQELGVGLAAGSDAPFGSVSPWLAMAAATNRRTFEGRSLSTQEALQPWEAFNLYSGTLESPSTPRYVMEGASADVILLDRDWGSARHNLADVSVCATWRSGELIHDAIN